MEPEGSRRAQSAMEYLMTYGWAILAIAIVMVSLYSLGIFNTGNLQPTATPGSCEVVRTAAQTSLAGQCNNLIPKYVGKFDGASSYIDAAGTDLALPNAFTMAVWVKSPTGTFASKSAYSGTRSNYLLNTAYLEITDTVGTAYDADYTFPTDNRWHFVVGVYDGTYMKVYLDGTLAVSTNIGTITLATTGGMSPDMQIGRVYYSGWHYYNGSIANLQIYNASLDNTSVKALYQEGIGGAPIDVRHIVGWWPLNGNANDYSGNNNQGTATNVIWNANWQSGYTSPTT